jgi:hypothetical protein
MVKRNNPEPVSKDRVLHALIDARQYLAVGDWAKAEAAQQIVSRYVRQLQRKTAATRKRLRGGA